MSEAFQVVAGWFLADLLGGAFHAFIDHVAAPTWPVLGGITRDFREHHDNRLSMEKYSRWPSLILGTLAMTPVVCLSAWYGLPWLAGTLLLGGLLTQHAHYYAHTPRPPRVARLLQQLGLFLSPQTHERHHGDPTFTRSYGVLNGWSHGALDLALGRRY